MSIPIEGHDLQTLHLQIGGQNATRLELADNYGIFEVPPLAPGAHDVFISLAGETLTLPQAIEVPVKRVSISLDKIYSMGNLNQLPQGTAPALDPVRATFTILDENGEPANGSYYIAWERTNGVPHNGMFRSISPVAINWQPIGGQFQVQNGQLVLEYQAVYQSYNNGEKHCGSSPCQRLSARFKVSACATCPVLFPEAGDTTGDEGRIYWTWLASADTPTPVEVRANGGDYPMLISNIRDSAGRIVPNGIAVSVTQPYWGYVHLGSLTTTKNGGTIPFIYTALQTSTPCWPSGDNTISRTSFGIGAYPGVRAEVRYLRGCP